MYICVLGIALLSVVFSSCEEFFAPEQELIRKGEEMFLDWDEYRSAAMGLYSLQQKLVDQIVVLGELRGDLLAITENATPDLIEVYNFNIRKDNIYASPVNFYKLISACNRLIQQLSSAYPRVLDKNQAINNYDRLYGEVLCMRAWAYFNAVRIYAKVPYIPEFLYTVEDIESYVNSQVEFVVPVFIKYAPNGFHNDTIRDTTIVLEKRFLDQKAVIDTFTFQLENKVKAVGVNHSINNNDLTWFVTTWNDNARHVLLGQMYFFDQNYGKAIQHFDHILYNFTSVSSNIKFGLDNKFEKAKWRNIFSGIDPDEHIYTLWFGKSYKQTHTLQSMFSIVPPNKYMVKPSAACIKYWETIWDNPVYSINNDIVLYPGIPGDFFRGHGVSYSYYKDGIPLSSDIIKEMLVKKQNGNIIDVQLLMNNVDTVVTKYDIGKNQYAHDANFIVYRAAGVHLYASEIYAVWSYYYSDSQVPRTNSNRSLNILNNGSYKNTSEDSKHKGVRGRVGFADYAQEGVRANDITYIHDPITNKIVGSINFTNNIPAKQSYLVEQILDEKAREMAFEGERFYDLIRIAKRRNDPAFLANKIAAKFPPGKRESIRNLLMNENNWYINFY